MVSTSLQITQVFCPNEVEDYYIAKEMTEKKAKRYHHIKPYAALMNKVVFLKFLSCHSLQALGLGLMGSANLN